jgi:hypothetical protein
VRSERIGRGMLQFNRLYRKHLLSPAVTVFTGGGIMALFRLSEPLDLTTPTGIEALETINKQLIAEVQAPDKGTYNADRVLRLPGTINFVSDVKRRRGRVDLAATVLTYADYNAAYAWDVTDFRVLFQKSARISANERREIAATAAEAAETTSCATSDAEINALTNKKVAAAKKRLAEDIEDDASDPDSVANILKWVSLPYEPIYLHMMRGWLHAVPCPDAYEDWYKYAIALKRLHWPDEIAFGLFDEFSKRSEFYSEDGVNAKWQQAHADITSRDRHELFTWRGIARLAMQCGYRPTEAQFDKIKQNDFEPSQLEMHNETHAYVSEHRAIYAFDVNKFISREEHKTECENIRVPVGKGDKIKLVPLDVLWRKWRQRRTHKAVIFAPGEKRITDKNDINIWAGFNYDLNLLAGVDKKYVHNVKIDFDTLIRTLANNNEADAHMLSEIIAYSLQHPNEKIYKAVLLAHPETGTGKSLLCELLAALHGPMHTANPSNDDLQGSFNDYLYAKTFVYCEEALTGDKRHLAQKLKSYITAETILINAKFTKPINMAARALWIFSANEPDALWIDPQDRRYLVIAPYTRNTQDFYARLGSYKTNPVALAAIAEYLLQYDTSGFSPKEIPVTTQAKHDSMELTRPELDAYLLDIIAGNAGRVNGRAYRFWTAREIANMYMIECKGKHSVTAVGRAMARLNIPKMAGIRSSVSSGQGTYYAVCENYELWREADYTNWASALRDDRAIGRKKAVAE